MKNTFQKYITQNHLCLKEDNILFAVSGGIDSVVMLHLFVELGYHGAIAHCNFNLRGDESDGDEEFVKQLGEKYNIPVHIKSCNTEDYAKSKKISIEMAARDLRYNYFKTLCQDFHYSKIAIAHNENDDKETFFIKLFRGSGLEGLKGILPIRKNIIRPLLFASRKQIESFAQANNLHFREDSSNSSHDFVRNKIRHLLIPFLNEKFPESKTSVSTSISKLKEENILLNSAIHEKQIKIFQYSGNRIFLNINDIISLNPPVIWLFYLLKDFGFHRSDTDAVYKSMLANNSGKTFYSSDYKLLIDRKKIIIQKKKKKKKTIYTITDFKELITKPISIKMELIHNTKSFSFDKTCQTAYFDAGLLKFPLFIRHWKKGDRFIPFGMQGSKLISDFFIDEKVNQFLKEDIWILESEKKEILWIIGYRASNLYKVSDKTQTILKFSTE